MSQELTLDQAINPQSGMQDNPPPPKPSAEVGTGFSFPDDVLDEFPPGYEPTQDEVDLLPVRETETPAPVKEDKPAKTADPAQGQKTSEPPAKDPRFEGIKPEVADLMREYAAGDAELDLNNPAQFKLLRMAAEKESKIRLDSLGADPKGEVQDYLDAFRDKPAVVKPAPAAAAAPPAGEQPRPAEAAIPAPPFFQIAEKWEKPSDFTKSFFDAAEMDDGPAKDEAVANTLLGFVHRAFVELIAPQFMQSIDSRQQQALGPLLNQVQESQAFAEREQVVNTLATMPESSDIMSIFEPAGGDPNATIKVQGGEVPDTWLNRAIAKFPEILDIEVKGRNAAETRRLTLAKQYRAAHRVVKSMRAQEPDPTAARKTAIETGKAIERSKQPDPVRHSLNAGASKVPPGGKNEGSIFGFQEDGEPMSSLFK